jgi:hypothetical protein
MRPGLRSNSIGSSFTAIPPLGRQTAPFARL